MIKRTLLTMCLALAWVVLSACDGGATTTTLATLDAPGGLTLEGAMLSWDAVEAADAYTVYINDSQVTTTDTYHMIDEEGTYDIHVIATGEGHGDSEPSGTLTFTLEFTDDVSFAIEKTDDGIRWDAVDEAVSYLVYVDGETFQTDDPSFSLTSLEPGLLEVRIQAVYPIGMSDVSASSWIGHDLQTAPAMYFQYSTHSTQDLMLYGIDDDAAIHVLAPDGEPLDVTDVLTDDDGLAIRSAYVLGAGEETVEFVLIADAMEHSIFIDMNDKQVPYIISSSVVRTDGTTDQNFQFELFGGSVQQISGTDLGPDDFDIDGNLLTIDADYIAARFAETDRFSINYALSGDDIVIGYIDFQKNT